MKRRVPTFVVLIGLALISLIAYSNSFHVPFQYDDVRVVRFNFSLRDLTNWKDIFLYERFRPLLYATFALNFHIGKQDPFSYHVVNLTLHVIAVSLFYFFLRRRSPEPLVAVAAAAFMAVHPLNTESVTYISSRSIVLCSIFYFLALLSFDSHLRKPRWYCSAAFFLCFFLASLVREDAALIPVSAFLYNFVFLGWDSVKKHRILHLATLGLLLAGAGLRLYTAHKYGGDFPQPLAVWLPTEVNVWLRYLWLALYPVPLNVDPEVPALHFASPVFWLSLFAVASGYFLLWKAKKQHPFLCFWGAWFFLNLLVSSSLIPLHDFLAEHRSYLSVFGYCAFLAYAAVALWKPRAKPAWLVPVVLTALISFYVTASYQRNRVWQNEFLLWYDSVQKSPKKIRPHLNLAAAYLQRKLYDLAIQEYLLVMELNPSIAAVYSGLGICYLQKEDLQNAEKYFREAIARDTNLIDAKTGLGVVLYRQAKYAEALRYFEQVYKHRQESVQLVSMMANSYLLTGRYTEAVSSYQRGIKLNPAEGVWYPGLMEAYFHMGLPQEALAVYDQHLQQFPKKAKTWLRTADILVRLGRKDDARRILENLLTDRTYGEEAKKRLEAIED